MKKYENDESKEDEYALIMTLFESDDEKIHKQIVRQYDFYAEQYQNDVLFDCMVKTSTKIADRLNKD